VVFDALPLDKAQTRQYKAGEILFYEGDPAQTLCLLSSGRCSLSRAGDPLADATPGTLLDGVAMLGGLPHSIKAVAAEACEVQCWSMDQLWQSASFAAAARSYLARELQQIQARMDELEAPIHYDNERAGLVPGPFLFDNVTMLMAFCEADLDGIRESLPAGLRLFRRIGRKRDSIFLALTRFPNSYPEHNPQAQFAAYTETTCFVPVRYGYRIGLYVPYIYPSTWEPILLGREIYGFPKRLGRTSFQSQDASLAVDGTEQINLHWSGLEAVDEAQLVGGLMGWLGLERHGAELAFRAGEVLRRTIGLPGYRRVEVYNHKRILAPEATAEQPAYAVDCLTHAIFGVLRWYHIERMADPVLTVSSGPLAGANLVLREAYRAQLDMRLSTGKMVCDYRNK
jgi:CRP-like cAMP-binding protein